MARAEDFGGVPIEARPEDFGGEPVNPTLIRPRDYGNVPAGGRVPIDPNSSFEEYQRNYRANLPPNNSVLSQLPSMAMEHAPEIGSLVGGAVGTAAPMPGGSAVGRFVGGLVGTGLGASIGTSVKQIDRSLRGEESFTPLLTEQYRNVAEQSLYQAIGDGLWKGASKGASYLMPKVRAGAVEAQRQLTPKGGTLSAGQALESPTVDLIESFARAGAGGKGRFITLEGQNALALEGIKEELIKNISSAQVNDRVAGKLFQDAIARGDAAHSAASTALYDAFDGRVRQAILEKNPLPIPQYAYVNGKNQIVSPEAVIDATGVSKYATDLSADLVRIGNVGKSETGGRLIDQLMNVPDKLTFADAQRLRSSLVALVRDLRSSSNPETKAIRTASGALARVENAMEEAAGKLPGDLFTEYRQVNAFYKKGKDAFNNDIMVDLISKEPERVGETLFQHGNVSEIIQAKASLRYAQNLDPSLNAKDAYQRLQVGFLNAQLTAKAATNIEGETTARNLLKDLAQARTDRQFAVMFSQEQRDEISRFARTAYLTLNNQPKNFGILAPLIQASAIADLALGASGGPSTRSPLLDIGILLSPSALARVLTNPKAVSVLTQAIRIPAAAGVSGPLFTKLVGDLRGAMMEDNPTLIPKPSPVLNVKPQGMPQWNQ